MLTASRENTRSTGAEPTGAQNIFITRNTKIHKILLSCGLVIHVKARMSKAKATTKASNPRSRPRPVA